MLHRSLAGVRNNCTLPQPARTHDRKTFRKKVINYNILHANVGVSALLHDCRLGQYVDPSCRSGKNYRSYSALRIGLLYRVRNDAKLTCIRATNNAHLDVMTNTPCGLVLWDGPQRRTIHLHKSICPNEFTNYLHFCLLV